MINALTSTKNAGDFVQTQDRLGPAMNIESQENKESTLELLLKELNSRNPTNKTNAIVNPIKDFINNKLIAVTTVVSALANVVSAPVHMFDEKNPLRKIINQTSLMLTKGHLIAYGISGLTTAFEQKNPFLVFSFLTEALSSVFGLRKIYLVRGLATGVDGAVSAIKKRSNTTHYNSWGESFKHTLSQFKEVCQEMFKDQSKLLSFDAIHTTVLSSIMMVFGAVFGVTANDRFGGWIRDIAGGFNDLGLSKLDDSSSVVGTGKTLDSKDAQRSGWLYLGGTVLDFVARVFNDSVANVLGIKETEAFNRLRDVFHELALAFDRGGQYFFAKFNQKKSQVENPTETRSSSKLLHASAFA